MYVEPLLVHPNHGNIPRRVPGASRRLRDLAGSGIAPRARLTLGCVLLISGTLSTSPAWISTPRNTHSSPLGTRAQHTDWASTIGRVQLTSFAEQQLNVLPRAIEAIRPTNFPYAILDLVSHPAGHVPEPGVDLQGEAH